MTDRPWWDPARHADRRPLLLTRNRIRRALTDWFEAEGFTEADPACLVAVPAAEVHLHALKVTTTAPDLTTGRAWLQTSPEFALKKADRRGRDTALLLRPGLARPRGRTAPRHGIHDAGMVPRRCRLHAADGGLRHGPAHRRRSRGNNGLPPPRRALRSLRPPPPRDPRRSLRRRGHRPARHPARDRPRAPWPRPSPARASRTGPATAGRISSPRP